MIQRISSRTHLGRNQRSAPHDLEVALLGITDVFHEFPHLLQPLKTQFNTILSYSQNFDALHQIGCAVSSPVTDKPPDGLMITTLEQVHDTLSQLHDCWCFWKHSDLCLVLHDPRYILGKTGIC